MIHLHPHHRLNPPVHDDVGDCVPVTLNLHSAVLPEIQSRLDKSHLESLMEKINI